MGDVEAHAKDCLMVEHIANTRNEAIEFARRTRLNLEYIETAAKEHNKVHVVTQLTLSLLGLVVFPKERVLLDHAETMTVEKMASEGWPSWVISDDPKCPTDNLEVLLRRLRNAICHARVVYNSDSRSIDDVTITVEDGPDPNRRTTRRGKEASFQPTWTASISAMDLREFCYCLINFVEQSIG